MDIKEGMEIFKELADGTFSDMLKLNEKLLAEKVQLKKDLEEAVSRLRLGGYDGDFLSRFPVEEKRPDETWVDDPEMGAK